MIIQIQDKNHFIIGCNDRDLMEMMKNRMDGYKVRFKNQIIIPIKSGPKIYHYKDYGIKWGTKTKEIVDGVIVSTKKRLEVIEKIKSQYGKKIKFDYDYKGIYDDALEHQKIMFNIMAYCDVSAIMADPGTCKTGPYLWAIDKRIQRGQVKKSLIITLSNLKENIRPEIDKQAPHLKSVVLKGGKSRCDKILNKKFKIGNKNADYDIYISNYESMFSLVDLFDENYFDMVILDEAHRIGSARSRQTKEIINKFESTKYKVIITGSLHANNEMSFFMPTRFLGPNLLPFAKFKEFQRNYMYAVDDEQRVWRPKSGTKKLVKKITGKLGVSFEKKDCLDLPPIISRVARSTMIPDQAKMHKSMRNNLLTKVEGLILKSSDPTEKVGGEYGVLAITSEVVLRRKLQQIESGFYIDTRSKITEKGREINDNRIITFQSNPKLDLLMQELSTIPSGKQVIIWTNYIYLIEEIQRRLIKEAGNKTSFIGRKGLITIGGKSREIKKILSFCNGLTTIEDILKKMLPTSSAVVLELLSLFEAHGIVRDSRELLLGFHEDSANPSEFVHNIGVVELEKLTASERGRKRNGEVVTFQESAGGHLLEIISNRRSIRRFKHGVISSKNLNGLLETTYGKLSNGHWSVPSGGGLYPLDIYLIIPDGQQSVPAGIYQWQPEEHKLVRVSADDPGVWIAKIFNAKTLTENVACIMCIGANLQRSASKYANLGYRLTVLEAGHAAQNAALFCAEQNLGCVECCGFGDKALAQKLGLDFPHEAIITTLIVGTPDASKDAYSSVSDREMVETAGRLRNILVGENKPIVDVSVWEPEVKGYAMPKWAATCQYRLISENLKNSPIKQKFAFATGITSSEATVKVLAEGFERYALEQSRSDRKAKASNLGEQFLDPRLVVPYSSNQFKILQNIEPFDPDREIDWVIGTRQNTGKEIWVPRELVYYGKKKNLEKGKPCYRASSNGVAAHFDKNIAIDSAMYELIERDAFSVMWYSKRPVPSVPHRLLPNGLKNRISCWKKLGFNVTLLDLTLDGPPVVMVLIWSEDKTPALCSGASCRPLFLDAANRAFDEAEFMAMSWQHRRPRRDMKMTDIKIPDDHGYFYVDSKNLKYVRWLLEATDKAVIRKDFKDSLDCFDPVVVDITPKEFECGLKVIRVLSDKLIPINFGYGNEHRGHLRMYELGYKWSMDWPLDPHFFA